MTLEEKEISQDIENTSAIASWSGFVYQGKVALYHTIKMLSEDALDSEDCLKLEHLDDFALFSKNDQAISTHQVKAKQDKYRSAYSNALSDAADVYSEHCSDSTQRYFHVSVSINDFSTYSKGATIVNFYSYHNGNQYLPLDEIDDAIKAIIEVYINKHDGLYNTPDLITYKFNKLNALINSKVNFIHAINQLTPASQYQAADTNPIFISEIIACLEAEVIDLNDESYILEMFRLKAIELMDEFIEHSSPNDSTVIEISECRRLTSGFNNHTLKKLFFSIDPKLKDISINFSENDIDRYIYIICSLQNLLIRTIFHIINHETMKNIFLHHLSLTESPEIKQYIK
jgi:hypothetical protein